MSNWITMGIFTIFTILAIYFAIKFGKEAMNEEFVFFDEGWSEDYEKEDKDNCWGEDFHCEDCERCKSDD